MSRPETHVPPVNADQVLSGQRRALARAITLVESRLDNHRQQAQQLLTELLPHTGNSIRIGISGVPGVGKSTFIEALGRVVLAAGHKVAVLAVDPSSPMSGGSILGDKTRMEDLSRAPGAFIRPSPAAGALGGVALRTRESLLLCEAAGYDVVLVETVGVGQSEFAVAGLVDMFLVMLLPNAGDELQGIKRGIIELADALIINKADGDAADAARRTRKHYESAMTLLRHADFWAPRILTCSARDGLGIDSVWQLVGDYREAAVEAGELKRKRANQSRDWMNKLLSEMLEQRLMENTAVVARRPQLEAKVMAGEITPYDAAQQLLALS